MFIKKYKRKKKGLKAILKAKNSLSKRGFKKKKVTRKVTCKRTILATQHIN